MTNVGIESFGAPLTAQVGRPWTLADVAGTISFMAEARGALVALQNGRHSWIGIESFQFNDLTRG